MSDDPAVAAAKARADAARKRFGATAAELQVRLSPSTIVHNAWAGAVERGSEALDNAVDRGTEVLGIARDRGSEAIGVAVDRSAEVLNGAVDRGTEVLGIAMDRGSQVTEDAMIYVKRRPEIAIAAVSAAMALIFAPSLARRAFRQRRTTPVNPPRLAGSTSHMETHA